MSERRHILLSWVVAFVLAFSLVPCPTPAFAEDAGGAAPASGLVAGDGDLPLTAGPADDTSATDDWLGELRFGTRFDSSDERFRSYDLEPEFDPEVHEYTLYVPDTESGIYAYGMSLLASGGSAATSDATYAAFTDTRGTPQEVNLSAYGTNGNMSFLTRCIARGTVMNELEITSPGGTQSYTVHVRRVASLMSLKAVVADDETELFDAASTEYELPVPLNCAGEELKLIAQPYYYDVTDEGNDLYQVRVNDEVVAAGEAWSHVMTGGEETVTVEVSWEGNRSTVYTVQVEPTDAGGSARFSVAGGGPDPAAVTVRVYNAHGVQVVADEGDPMRYAGLFVGRDYTYRAVAPGWKSLSGSFTAKAEGEPIELAFAERSKGRYLDDLMVYPNSSGSVAGNYPIERAEDMDGDFGATVYTVDYSSQQTSDAFYLAAVLSDSAPEGARIKVSAWGLDGQMQEMTLPDSEPGLPVRRKMPKRTFEAGPQRAVYWIDVGIGADVERYAVVVMRDLQLANLRVSQEPGGSQMLEQDFKRSVHDYDVSVMRSVEYLWFEAAPYAGLEDAVLEIGGMSADGGQTMVFLEDERLQDVRVELSLAGTYADPALAGLGGYESRGVYTVHVERLVPVDVSFSVDPDDAIVAVYDRKGTRANSMGDGRTFEGLYEGRTYTYTVTRHGCAGVKDTFVAEDGLVVPVSLDGATAQHPELTSVEWWNYRNNYENNGLTSATTPDSAGNAALKWQTRIGGDYGSSATPPLVADGALFTASGKYVYKLDKATGEVLAVSDELAGDVVYALNSMTYAEGMLFVQIGRGRIQAISATTMRSLWVSEAVGGQTLSPITYRNGYIYTGTWVSESKPGEYLCISVTDEDPSRPDEEKLCSWRWSRAGGFYWAGAYVDEGGNYAVFGTDDGASEGDYVGEAALVSVKPATGEQIDSLEGVVGDVRSSVVYDGGAVYFVTKGGVLYRVAVSADGHFGAVNTLDLGGMATSSPVVCAGRVYVGVCGEGGQFNADGGHSIAVVDASRGGLSLAYAVEVPGYPQAAMLATDAYAGKDFDVDGKPDGRVYVYFTCNARPGGIYMIVDEPGAREAQLETLWVPDLAQQQFCISPICTDGEGTLYYKNDSGYMFAVTANDAYLIDAQITPDSGKAKWDAEFVQGRLGYRVMVLNAATSVAFTLKVPTGRSVTVGGAAYTEGMKVPLAADGAVTEVPVTVTYQGKQRTYLFTIEPLGTDATLKELFCSVSNNALQTSKRLALDPEFDPEVTEYEAAECADARKFVNLWAVANGSYASVEVEGVSGVSKINVFRNANGSYGRTRYAVYFGQDEACAKVRVTMTAGDGVTKRVYNVVLRRPDTYSPKIEDAIGHRLDADNAAVLFRTNETGTYAWTVTGPDDEAPERPQPAAESGDGGNSAGGEPAEGEPTDALSGTAQLVEGANRIELPGIGPKAHAVWIWATDKVGNATAVPVRVDIAAWKSFPMALSVSPADATIELTDSAGATIPIGGAGASRTAQLIEGNIYTIHASREGCVEMTDRFTADSAQASYEVKLEDLRSTDSKLKGLYVSSSSKWGSGIQKLSPGFAAGVARYEAAYDGERTHMYLWPVTSDAKAKVTVYAVGGVRGDTVAKDETIAGEAVDGHPVWKVYFADGSLEAQVRVHVVAEDGGATDYFVKMTIRDTTPPVLTKVSASRLSAGKASAVFKTSEAGRYWYKVVKAGAKAPNMTPDGAGEEMQKGTVTITLEGLKKGACDVYVLAVDADGNAAEVLVIPVPDVRKSSKSSKSSEGGEGAGRGKPERQAQRGAAGTPTGSGGVVTHAGQGGTAGTLRHESAGTAAQAGAGKVQNDKTGAVAVADALSVPTQASSRERDAALGGPGTVGAAIGDQADSPVQAFLDAPWWLKGLIVFAGLGIAYLAFWAYSAVKNRRRLA